jgi:hypothetical protein
MMQNADAGQQPSCPLKINKNPALNKDGVFIWNLETNRNTPRAEAPGKMTP